MTTKLNKLTTITAQYHSFVNDQVLTADQLNTLIQYFDDQGRLSRVCLNGVGIACGFNISMAENNEIIVSQGCGITTDGDLIKLQKNTTDESTRDIDIQSIRFTHYKSFQDKNVKYPFFFNGENQIALYELVPDFQLPKTDCFLMSTLAGIQNMVVLLYQEEFSKIPELCTAIDCNNQGIEEVSRLKVLLCSEEDARYINNSDPIYTKHSVLPAYLNLPEVAVQRVLLTNSSATSQINLQKSFQSAISANNTLSQLKSGIAILLNDFKGLLNLPSNITTGNINLLINNVFGYSASAIPNDVQYRYDLLKDLVDTYNEIKELLLQLDSECCPDIESFPKHLMLGMLTASPDNEPFRHSFYKSPFAGKDQQNILCFNSLITRFLLMLSQYNISGTETKITPSKIKVPLSDRSIPYYFNIDNKLIDNWNYLKTRRLMQKSNLCYFTSNLSAASHIQYPLKFNLDAFDFFRIEGHLGISPTTADSQLNDQLTSNGLDFNYLAFDIDNDQSDLQIFINKNNSLEHLAGVPRGGTFILVKKANQVIADFALSYRYLATESDSCCKISECSYPWFSSLKYLNNLSRSLKGTQSRKVQMPRLYRLFITEYSINGINLIAEPVELSIPLTDVFLRRLHVVIEKLNERFPTGLVFDFDQEKKQLKIKKLKDDTFIFKVKDITLIHNSPVYTYTESGYMKDGQMLNARDITCAEIRIHHQDFYKKLHDKYNPRNKDDDYGRYNDKWSRWNGLVDSLIKNSFFVEKKQKRFIKQYGDLPGTVREDLHQIKNGVSKIKINAKVYLSGEWVNGTWVDAEMMAYFADHQKNTHDDIVVFIKLRQSLHQKSGKSRFVIFVDTITDDQLKDLQNKFLSKADLYMGKAEGETFIEIE